MIAFSPPNSLLILAVELSLDADLVWIGAFGFGVGSGDCDLAGAGALNSGSISCNHEYAPISLEIDEEDELLGCPPLTIKELRGLKVLEELLELELLELDDEDKLLELELLELEDGDELEDE